MPSPFPGMDPFLEHPDIFPDVHDSFNAYLRELLQAQLPEPYYARIGRRAWIEVSHRYIGPDVNVLRSGPVPSINKESGGGTAVAVAPSSRAVVIRVPHDEQQEPFVEIYMGRGEAKRLVTTLEVLSLANKTPGEHGRSLYLRKQQEILGSKVNLVEIDLLRAGEHSTAVPRERVHEAGPFDYHVCVHQFDNLEDFAIYPIQLQDCLPEIAIPLLSGDSPVILNLQAVFERCYDTGHYQTEIRYLEESPVPPLRPEQTKWARELLESVVGQEVG